MSVPDNNHRQNDNESLSKTDSMDKKINAKVLIPYYIYLPSDRQTQNRRGKKQQIKFVLPIYFTLFAKPYIKQRQSGKINKS